MQIVEWTPEQSLVFHAAAFKDLFSREPLDLPRFLRLIVETLDPARGYFGKCKGDGTFLPLGCGKEVKFKTAARQNDDGSVSPCGYLCPECGEIFLWCMSKGQKAAPGKLTISYESSNIGGVVCETQSGLKYSDAVLS